MNSVLKIFMQVFFVVTFLSLFFFLYVVDVEKEIFQAQIDIVVDNLFDSMQSTANLVLPGAVQDIAKRDMLDYLNNATIPSENYDSIREQNNQVIDATKNIVIIFATLLGACVFGAYFLRFCVNMPHHLIENGIALCAVALTEYLFLNLISRNYISANPNHIKMYFAQQVVAYSQTKLQ